MTDTAKNSKRLLGAHVSSAGGTYKAMERANEIGANCAQIFSGSPRLWKRPKPTNIDAEKLSSEREKYNVKRIYIHALYLINLAARDEKQVKRSMDSLKAEMEICSHIKSSGLIVHVGSHKGEGWDVVKEDIATRIKDILDSTPKDSVFLIENSAGQRGKIGSDLEEIKWLIDKVDDKRLRWCLDTCHAFASGYELKKGQSTEGKNGKSRGLLVDEISRLKLWDTLEVIHVNDSKGDFHSGIDRHQNLGEGNIGQASFEVFLNHQHLKSIPLILEVPGLDGKGPDKENMDILKSMVK